jgi:hypothetical protein
MIVVNYFMGSELNGLNFTIKKFHLIILDFISRCCLGVPQH